MLDPLIEEAKRRMRRRRLLVAALIVALVGGATGAMFALRGGPQHASRSGAVGQPRPRPPSPVPDHVVVNVFGQPSRPAELAGRPLDKTLDLFRSGRLAAALPAPSGAMKSLAFVAAHMLGDPGTLLLNETRRVVTPAGPIYLVPTTRGWACMQGKRFETCHRGLLRQGISWQFGSDSNGVDVVGIAADRVSGVSITQGTTERRASLHNNVFFVHLPASSTKGEYRFPLGTLTISYRDGKPKASVPLR